MTTTSSSSEAEPAANAPAVSPLSKPRSWRDGPEWFNEHYHEAAGQIVAFLHSDRIPVEGMSLADIGCGDGIIDLGVMHKAKPRRLVGFDILETDTDRLARLAAAMDVARGLPPGLEFRKSDVRSLPGVDDEFDIVFSWSAFEHIADPVSLLLEVRRVLKPNGTLMIQIWPFFHSQHGSHLWEWFPEGFTALTGNHDDAANAVRADLDDDPDWARERFEEFHELNRLTLDDLQRSLLAAGFRVAKLEVIGTTVHLPYEVARYPLSQLGIDGVKLLATGV